MKNSWKRCLCLIMVTAIVIVAGCADPEDPQIESGGTETVGVDPGDVSSPSADAERYITLDWDISGTWIKTDGTILGETESLSVTAKLPEEFKNYSEVLIEVDFGWPDSFGYQNEGNVIYTGNANTADKHGGIALYHGSGWLNNSEKNDYTSFSFTICPEKCFLVIHIGNVPEYLVASTDPNAEPQEIMSFYQEYVAVLTE